MSTRSGLVAEVVRFCGEFSSVDGTTIYICGSDNRQKSVRGSEGLSVSEVILSALASDWAVVDGVDGAMMIAAETTCATAIVFPFRRFAKLYVADGTHLCTFAAMDADIGIDGEFPVGNHEAVKISSYDVAEGPRGES